MRKNIHKMLEPTLLDLFYQFRQGLKFEPQYLEKELEKFKKEDGFILQSLTHDEYYFLCKKEIYTFYLPDEPIHCCRCILRIQRDLLSDRDRCNEIEALKYWNIELNKKDELFIEI